MQAQQRTTERGKHPLGLRVTVPELLEFHNMSSYMWQKALVIKPSYPQVTYFIDDITTNASQQFTNT